MSAPLLTTADLATILGIDPDTAEVLRRRNHWPCVKLTRTLVRYTQAQADAIVAQHTVTAPAASPVGRVAGQTARSAARSA